jgi:sugar phosphate isomerase/epimerase
MPFCRYGNAVDMAGFTPAMRRRIRAAFADAGVEVLSQGAYMDLSAEDDTQRRENLDYFAARLRMMHEMGGEVLVTESGPQPEEPSAQRAAWDRFRASLAELIPIAAAEGVAIGLEPSRAQVLKDAATARLLLHEFGTDRLKVMIDPANILGLETLEEMFATLRGSIFQGHAKDVILGGEKPVYPPAGQGQLEYPLYVRLLREHSVPALVIEYVTEEDFAGVRDYLQGVLGATEA